MTDGWVIIAVPEPGIAIAVEWPVGSPRPDPKTYSDAARDLVVRLYRDLMDYAGESLEEQMQVALRQDAVDVMSGRRLKYMLTGRDAGVGEGSLQTYHA